jgi:hypothetical protein
MLHFQKRARVAFLISLAGVAIVASACDQTSTDVKTNDVAPRTFHSSTIVERTSIVTTTTVPPTTTAVVPTTVYHAPATAYRPPVTAAASCPNGTYTNSSGHEVCSPYSSPNGPPAGATAKCNDGTYSSSEHRQGTCSGHGGVAEWY